MANIIRVQKDKNYVVMNRTALNDKKLSWKAKGIIAYMLSMPDDWVFYEEELISHSADGRDSFRSGFKELRDNGYVERRPIKDKQTKRIIKWETIVHEIPTKSLTEKPLTDFPEVEKPLVENPTLLNTDNKLNTDITNYSTTTATADREQEIFRAVQENIRFSLSPIEIQTIECWIKEYPHDLILEAVKRAVLKNKISIGYVESILKDWQKKRITTLEEVQRDDEQFKQRFEKRGGNHQSNKPNRTALTEFGVDVGF